MRMITVTPVRLLGDALVSSLAKLDQVEVVSQVDRISLLREALAEGPVDVVVIDTTQGIDLDEVRAVAMAWPQVALVALGLEEQRQEVIRCGRAGFAGYFPRHASIETLHRSLQDAVAGRLACPGEISGALMRALFRMPAERAAESKDAVLTEREGDVIRLLGQGRTNKEIARELDMSVATVKHHVHSIFSKLKLHRRADVMRLVRDTPWIAASRVPVTRAGKAAG